MLPILLAIVSAFIAYSLCKENKITTLIALNFLINIIGKFLQTGTYNIMLYVVAYLIYAIIVSYLALFAYKLSSSFLGFLFIAAALNIIVGLLLFYAIGLIIKGPII